eukprot:3033795-Rhodomonas_salina.1
MGAVGWRRLGVLCGACVSLVPQHPDPERKAPAGRGERTHAESRGQLGGGSSRGQLGGGPGLRLGERKVRKARWRCLKRNERTRRARKGKFEAALVQEKQGLARRFLIAALEACSRPGRYLASALVGSDLMSVCDARSGCKIWRSSGKIVKKLDGTCLSSGIRMK